MNPDIDSKTKRPEYPKMLFDRNLHWRPNNDSYFSQAVGVLFEDLDDSLRSSSSASSVLSFSYIPR